MTLMDRNGISGESVEPPIHQQPPDDDAHRDQQRTRTSDVCTHAQSMPLAHYTDSINATMRTALHCTQVVHTWTQLTREYSRETQRDVSHPLVVRGCVADAWCGGLRSAISRCFSHLSTFGCTRRTMGSAHDTSVQMTLAR